MFLFAPLPLPTILMGLAVLAGLMLINELTRMNKWIAVAFFIGIPVVFTFLVWPNTAVAGSSVGTWFHWAKLYSVLACVMVIMAIRFIKGADKNKIMLFLPALILALNIMEAVVRDFEVSRMTAGFIDGMNMHPGIWNIMNGVAGLLNIITISGWVGIFVDRKHKQNDMLWADQLWFWVIAYDLWNFAYVYNCVPDHAFYAGLLLLLSCTIPAFFIKKGAWLQHRAHTLATWMMFVMTVPAFVDTSKYAVKSSGNETALFVVSFLALAANIAVFVYHVYKIVKHKRNPLKTEVYSDLKVYKEIAANR